MHESCVASLQQPDGKDESLANITARVLWLSRALRERRLSLGEDATQQAIAARAKISVRQLQKIEQGAAIPRVDTLLALTDALRTDLQSMLDRAEVLRHRSVKRRSPRGADRAGRGDSDR